jgi:glyoxylase-like metal-dependent hydrolase (beta-lactamase superfamily II)
MQVYKLTYNPFQENTFVVADEDKNCVIIDPGCYFSEEKKHFLNFITSNRLKPLALLNTHAHLDHIFGNSTVLENFDLPYYLHEKDLPLLAMAEKSAALYGMHEFLPSPEPTHFLQEGETLNFGKINFQVIYGPGHAPGHVAFYNSIEKILINGDILFQGSYGRVDLPGGNLADLKHTIINKLFKLPEDTTVFCGHGGETTIGKEKQNNPIHYS